MSQATSEWELLEKIVVLLQEMGKKLDTLDTELSGINSNTAQTTYMTGWELAKPKSFTPTPRHPNRR
jgi:hypothetical protein